MVTATTPSRTTTATPMRRNTAGWDSPSELASSVEVDDGGLVLSVTVEVVAGSDGRDVREDPGITVVAGSYDGAGSVTSTDPPGATGGVVIQGWMSA